MSDTITMPNRREERFEQILDNAKFGNFDAFLLTISGLVLTHIYLESSSVIFVIPVSQCEMKWSIEQRGVLTAVSFVGMVVSGHFWAFLADTTGRKKTMLPSLLLGFVFSLLSSFSTTFWILATMRFLNGVCISAGAAIIYAYVGEFYSMKNCDRAILATATVGAVGAILLPIFAWFVINRSWSWFIPFLDLNYNPWRLYIVVCAIPGLICGLAFVKLPESPKFLLSVGKEKEALRIVMEVMGVDDAETYSQVMELQETKPLTPIIEEEDQSNRGLQILKNMWHQTTLLFSKKFLKITILTCYLQIVVFATAWGMYMWFPDILNSVIAFTESSPNTSSTICSIYRGKLDKIFNDTNILNDECSGKFEISTYKYSLITDLSVIIGSGVITFIITRISNTFLIWITLTISGLAIIAAGMITAPMAAIYFYIVQINSCLAIPVIGSTTVALYPTNLRAMAVNMSIMLGHIGAGLGANYIGALLKDYCEVTFYTCGTLMCLTGCVAFLVPKPRSS